MFFAPKNSSVALILTLIFSYGNAQRLIPIDCYTLKIEASRYVC